MPAFNGANAILLQQLLAAQQAMAQRLASPGQMMMPMQGVNPSGLPLARPGGRPWQTPLPGYNPASPLPEGAMGGSQGEFGSSNMGQIPGNIGSAEYQALVRQMQQGPSNIQGNNAGNQALMQMGQGNNAGYQALMQQGPPMGQIPGNIGNAGFQAMIQKLRQMYQQIPPTPQIGDLLGRPIWT